MLLLHTADWHVGKTLKGRSRLEEQRAVLAEITGIALNRQVDAVLLAGDVFDSAAPTADAQRVVYETLLTLARAGIEVIVIAGNHDHARTFEALRDLMAQVGIEYAGRLSPATAGGVHRFTARSTGERAVVALLPFLSRRGIIGAAEIVTGTESANAGRYEESIRAILAGLAGGFSPETVNLVLAHLTTTGGVMGGGEREAQTIMEYHVSPAVFPPTTQYVALGHLHRRQQIQGPGFVPIHYAGAPLAVDFGEESHTPVVCLVEVAPGSRARVTDVPLAQGRRLRTVTGTVEELVAGAPYDGDYLRVVVREPTRAGLRDDILAALPDALEIRIHPDFQAHHERRRADHMARSPHDLFVDYCAEAGLADPRLTALFDELLEESNATSPA
ncbi:MAG: exonuclease SbcCD subunit D [Propionibacteriaceae bacterium]|nr:exonuclease SbcCD subunit D [Propionibacteriaceae bacterium]